MGEVTGPMPQGPMAHCGKLKVHDKHPHPRKDHPNSWCDGVEPLKPFVELTVRVPLAQFGFPDQMPLEELVANIRTEGLGTFLVDEMDSPQSSVALRVRWAGEDRVYPVVKGVVEGVRCGQ